MSATCPDSPTARKGAHAGKPQRGFALVSAIFLLVIMAVLGTAMLMMSAVQNATSAQDVQGSRAYQAARAGIEWGFYLIMTPENATPFVPGARADCTAIPVANPVDAPNLVLGGTLAGFGVNVACAGGADIVEGDNTIRVFTLTSRAWFGVQGNADYIERQLSATLATCRKTATNARCGGN